MTGFMWGCRVRDHHAHWNSPLESAAKVKGRRQRSPRAGFGAEVALEESRVVSAFG